MKRVGNVLVILMILMLAAACTSPAGGDQGASSKGKKALFVGREEGGDAITIKHLKQLGYEVAVVTDKELKADNATGHTLVFVSSTVNSGKVGNKLKASPVPVIYAESQNLGDIRLSGKATDEDNGDFSGKSVAIQAAGHPMAAGLQGSVDVYKQDGKIGFIVPGGEGTVIASALGDARRAVICAFEKGAKNMDNEPPPARQVYFYLVDGEEINQTENGWKLFDAAVQWAAGSKP
ncbi:hypothetical protein LJK87_20585 [Paenibacillus sp. P25]|nr:hypothetical protein LJK87_20585 [Paenibacillus sp. P25]